MINIISSHSASETVLSACLEGFEQFLLSGQSNALNIAIESNATIEEVGNALAPDEARKLDIPKRRFKHLDSLFHDIDTENRAVSLGQYLDGFFQGKEIA
jgi:hypothetical protein